MLCRASFSVNVPYFSVNQEFVTQKDILILLIVKVKDQPGRDYFIIQWRPFIARFIIADIL